MSRGDVFDNDDSELHVAELAATRGPAFELWRVPDHSRTLVLADFDLADIRHIVDADGAVVVHQNDRRRATAVVELHAGPDLEMIDTREVDDGEANTVRVELETVYTAGDLPTAGLIKARLAAAGIDSVLRYDPTLGVAAHLAPDRTVRVQVPIEDIERARIELDGDDLDTGSAEFQSRAWSTPWRRIGAGSLLVFLVCLIAPFVLVIAYLILTRIIA
ncbi:MAG: hypothetical protein GXP35_06040 [Actinobacteria bacterium]|nr:hypothetical protein [Actinomycetota bacterium]